ncbi:MAG: DUF4321 domain-containing protein [Elusimicrobiota bacterium]|nr:DUF4321 domain-containing protein [Endomicrobiia bacterium]MDW8056105.1 DUF4321 domain-containing protein [Elusimicrobiota bacterium]
MSKGLINFILIVIIGTLLGAFIGKAISKFFPSDSNVKEMLSLEIKPGLQPTTIDLGILEITFGAVVKLNITAVVGLILTAIIFRKLIM